MSVAEQNSTSQCNTEAPKGLQIGPGQSRWGNIHIADLSRIFLRLVEKAVEGNKDSNVLGANGLYFAGVGELSFGEISRRVAAAAYDLHLIPSREVDEISGEEADRLLPHGSYYSAQMHAVERKEQRRSSVGSQRTRAWSRRSRAQWPRRLGHLVSRLINNLFG
ncbi:hypothetical protein IWW34DRAFT_794676 [Fusarium oxysporum f. sp. albedinis]|nr:hypothetical protein IWW34DRAFT_794676 [Fusarium oxysporum f. sp. albedinis]